MPAFLVRHLVERLGAIRHRVRTRRGTTLVVDLGWILALYPARGN